MEIKNVKEMDAEMLYRIIQTIPSCIFFKDTDLKYVFSTHYWSHLNNVSNEFDICGKTDRDIRRDQNNVDAAESADRQVINTGKGISYTIKTDIAGEIQYLDIKKEPVFDGDGRVIGIVGLINDVTSSTIWEEKLEKSARVDELTGILSRKAGTLAINDEIQTDDNKYFCILNLDKFRQVNDNYGHDVGDMVLVEVAKTLDNEMSEGEIVCRIGGDEFAILLCTNDANNLINNRIARIFERIEAIEIEDYEEISVKVSLGITRVHKRDSFDSLYMYADEAVREAKKEHKNSFKWY